MDKSVRITKRVVDGIKPNGTEFHVWDTELIGFGIRVRETGSMSYVILYRAGAGRRAPTRRMTIAKIGKVTPDQARNAAKSLLASVVKGEDPAKKRAEDRTAPTFADLVDAFLLHIKAKRKPNTYAQYRHLLKAYAVPKLGARKASDVTANDIAGLHLSLKEKGTTANRVRDVTSAMFNWAMKSKLIGKMENPAAGIDKFREAKRERFLNSDEIQRLGAAIREAETVGIP